VYIELTVFRGLHLNKEAVCMKIDLKNIGKIRDAAVELNGITVIAGENNTGKSTVGKALFSVFNSFYNIDNQIFDERVSNIESIIDNFYFD
jgi:predicted ATPase